MQVDACPVTFEQDQAARIQRSLLEQEPGFLRQSRFRWHGSGVGFSKYGDTKSNDAQEEHHKDADLDLLRRLGKEKERENRKRNNQQCQYAEIALCRRGNDPGKTLKKFIHC